MFMDFCVENSAGEMVENDTDARPKEVTVIQNAKVDVMRVT